MKNSSASKLDVDALVRNSDVPSKLIAALSSDPSVEKLVSERPIPVALLPVALSA